VTRVKSIRENAVESELVRRVESAGGACEKVQSPGSRGFFDRLVILPGGLVVFVECKRPQGGRLSPHQLDRHKKYRALGCVVAIVKSSADIDRLMT
jgi:Holliday junction resolvase